MRRLLVLVAASPLLACTSSDSASHPPPPIPSTFPDAPLGTQVAHLSHPSHIVSDGVDLYVTAGGEVARIPLDGGAGAAYPAPNPWGLAVDDTHVYWADQRSEPNDGGPGRGMIRRMPKDGGAPETLVESDAVPLELALDDTNVYWTDHRFAAAAIRSMPKDAVDASATTLLTFDGGLPFGITLDPTHVYWTESKILGRVAKAGGAAETLASYEFGPFVAPASDDGGVYFSRLDVGAIGPHGRPGQVWRLDTQTNATVPTGASSSPSGLFSDGRYVYWTDHDWGVLAAPVAGGPTMRIASNTLNASPMGLTVVNGIIYWVAFEENAVRSIRGPAAP